MELGYSLVPWLFLLLSDLSQSSLDLGSRVIDEGQHLVGHLLSNLHHLKIFLYNIRLK